MSKYSTKEKNMAKCHLFSYVAKIKRQKNIIFFFLRKNESINFHSLLFSCSFQL